MTFFVPNDFFLSAQLCAQLRICKRQTEIEREREGRGESERKNSVTEAAFSGGKNLAAAATKKHNARRKRGNLIQFEDVNGKQKMRWPKAKATQWPRRTRTREGWRRPSRGGGR